MRRLIVTPTGNASEISILVTFSQSTVVIMFKILVSDEIRSRHLKEFGILAKDAIKTVEQPDESYDLRGESGEIVLSLYSREFGKGKASYRLLATVTHEDGDRHIRSVFK